MAATPAAPHSVPQPVMIAGALFAFYFLWQYFLPILIAVSISLYLTKPPKESFVSWWKTQNEKAAQQSLGSIGSKLWGQFAKLALPQPQYVDYQLVWVAYVPRENQKPLVVVGAFNTWHVLPFLNKE